MGPLTSRLAALIAAAACVCGASAIDVTSPRAVIMDADTGKVLFAKNADSPSFPASTTKILTALLLIERTRPDDVLVAPADVEEVGESSMHLRPGERIKARDLLVALMLRSANDGAHTVAVNLAGSDKAFADMMNARARALGCTLTNFTNPHGLHDPQHLTTARALALIAREAMRHADFRTVVSTLREQIERTGNLEDRLMVNRNKWLRKDATADGIKTGYTVPAGHCYVGSASRQGHRIITVLLRSASWQADHQALLAWAFANFDHTRVGQPKTAIGTVAVAGGTVPTVRVAPFEPVFTMVGRGRPSGARVALSVDEPVASPVKEGQRLGTATYTDGEGFEQTVPVVATAAVPQAPFVRRAADGFLRHATWIAFAGVGGYAFVRMRRPRRQANVGLKAR